MLVAGVGHQRALRDRPHAAAPLAAHQGAAEQHAGVAVVVRADAAADPSQQAHA